LFIKNTCASLLSDSLKKLSFLFSYLGKWFFLALLVGALSGSASTLFLHALDWTTQTRESNYWLLMFFAFGRFVNWSYLSLFWRKCVKRQQPYN
jgi:uncharacterized protein with ParB-like and HNH nuclease domain